MSIRTNLAAGTLLAVLAFGATMPAQAATKTKTYPHCTRNSVSNIDAGSGTNSATTGIRTAVHSTTPNMSGPPVQNNTPANTNASNINSNNPGVHQKQDPCAVRKARNRRKHH